MLQKRCFPLTVLVGLLSLLSWIATAAEFTSARVAVYFSPSGGATDTVVRELNAATTQILVQAYSFTSAPIAKTLVEAHKRGVTILAVLDKSNETKKYSAATFLMYGGIQTLIDDQHAIAHNKVLVIDSATVLTGSFNFTKAAEQKNTENLLVIKERTRAGQGVRGEHPGACGACTPLHAASRYGAASH
jgi:phosphatidylserine/phosphatidylglycerophosphate/cardiolipin synthase-like enzyme